jgi:hypothetical protein
MGKLAVREDVVRALRERDFIYLTGLIRERLSAEDRDELAELILGLLTRTVKLPAHRPPKELTRESGFEIAWRVEELTQSGWTKRGAAVRKAVEEFGCSDSKVWQYG